MRGPDAFTARLQSDRAPLCFHPGGPFTLRLESSTALEEEEDEHQEAVVLNEKFGVAHLDF